MNSRTPPFVDHRCTYRPRGSAATARTMKYSVTASADRREGCADSDWARREAGGAAHRMPPAWVGGGPRLAGGLIAPEELTVWTLFEMQMARSWFRCNRRGPATRMTVQQRPTVVMTRAR